jgi:hypothetical protein
VSARRRSVAAPVVAASVADLDHSLVAAVLARHSCNVTDAAQDLGVPPSDLRRLLWANPKLQDEAFEVVEGRIDLAESNIAEFLRSSDGRERLAASMFTLRNSARSRRRGWITSAAAVDLTVGSEPPRNIVIRWANEKEDGEDTANTIARDGRRIAMPRYGGGETAAVEGSIAEPSILLEHVEAAESAEEQVAVEPTVVVREPELAAARYERERIDAWIRNRLIDWPLAACMRCRTPIVAGAEWREVSNGEARARIHLACHIEWWTEQEAAARQALGLEG